MAQTITKKPGEDIIIIDSEVTEPPPTTGDCECDIKAGVTTTLAPGSQATVAVRKENKTHFLDIGVPRGDKGDPGNDSGGTPPPSVSLGKGYADVFEHGAKGDGSADDTAAFQRAWDALKGTGGDVVVRPPNAYFKFMGTLNAFPADGRNQVWTNIKFLGQSIQQGIKYFGPSNAPVIRAIGFKPNRIEGIKVEIMAGRTNCQAIDFITRGGAGSQTGLQMVGGYIILGDGANQAFRFDEESSTTGNDISFFDFYGIDIYGSRKPGQHAYFSQGPNVLAMNVHGGGICQVDSIFSNWSDQNSDNDRGGSTWNFFGTHTSGNLCNFYMDREGTLGVFGGRYEHDDMILRTKPGAHNRTVTFHNIRANDCKGTGNAFEMNGGFSLELQNCEIHRSTIGGVVGFTDLIRVNSGEPNVVRIKGGQSRYQRLVGRTAGTANCKVYTEGFGMYTADGTARYVERRIDDLNGQLM